MSEDNAVTVGRPSTFSPEVATEIYERLAAGESMAKICRSEHMPDRATVWRWARANSNFATECARARELHAFDEFDSMTDIENRTLGGEVDPRAASVVLTSMQWRLSKVLPKLCGNNKTVDHTGEVTVKRVILSDHRKLVTNEAQPK